jgi:hypothetical protein
MLHCGIRAISSIQSLHGDICQHIEVEFLEIKSERIYVTCLLKLFLCNWVKSMMNLGKLSPRIRNTKF